MRKLDLETMPQSPLDPGVALMLAYQAGEERAFDRLVELYAGQVYALLTRFLGPVHAREDLVQEVFLRVIRARERYQPSAKFSTWLFTIVFNLSANEHARSSARHEASLDAPHGEEPGENAREPADPAASPPSAELEREDVVLAVRRAILELPERQRMALVLAKYHGLDYVEVAEAIGAPSEKAVKSMIHRAREALRVRLAPFLQEELA